MLIQIISLFPEMFDSVLNASMLQKAQNKKLVTFQHINLRDFGKGQRRQVDDTPYGGGDGMLLMVEPLHAAILAARQKSPKAQVILMTPKGQMFNQKIAVSLARQKKDLIFICARYEGYDERVVKYVDLQCSIGNYILTGGEIPAMTVIDSVVRLIPGVLGGDKSAAIESFMKDNQLEYPQYTRPESYDGLTVPAVLLSGNHLAIDQWRKKGQIV